MSSPNIEMENVAANIPYQTMRGHIGNVNGAVNLPSGRHIITCSNDGSLRLWDLESGAQIGDDWRDGVDEVRVSKIALSPNGGTVASGSDNGTVRLWDVETGKVIAQWKWHSDRVSSVCWSPDGQRVVSGSWDGTAIVWDVKSGKTALNPIMTGHTRVWVVTYSPDSTKFATGGLSGVNIWDAKTCDLLATIKHDLSVCSLAWTSDGKLFCGSNGLIRVLDTAQWQQIAILQGHTDFVTAITLSQNDCLLVTASNDNTARLWKLDTNVQVGLPLQHEERVKCATLSADGTVLVTGCDNKNVYAWDIQAILKKAGFENVLPVPNVAAETLSTDADDMQGSADSKSAQVEDTRPLLQGYIIDDTPGSVHSSMMYHHSNDNKTPRLQSPSRHNSISHHGCSLVGIAAVQDKGALYVAPRPRPLHVQTTSTTTPPDATTTGAAPVQLRPIIIDKHTWWTRFWLVVCCASARYADS